MKNLSILLLLMALCIIGCSNTNDSNKVNQYIYWVNSQKVECVGVGPMLCLQIQKGEEIVPDQWTLFYSSISGFEYEQGYIYKLVVKEDSIPAEQVPADGSSIKYTLVKMIDKQFDRKTILHDIWVLESIKGEQIETNPDQKRPFIEINLAMMRVMGNDGCNNFTGGINKVDSESLVFGPIAGTRMACIDMNVPDRFNQVINSVRSYRIKNLNLYLFDQEGTELLTFKKGD